MCERAVIIYMAIDTEFLPDGAIFKPTKTARRAPAPSWSQYQSDITPCTSPVCPRCSLYSAECVMPGSCCRNILIKDASKSLINSAETRQHSRKWPAPTMQHMYMYKHTSHKNPRFCFYRSSFLISMKTRTMLREVIYAYSMFFINVRRELSVWCSRATVRSFQLEELL